jgi:hypothetical protein
VALALVVACSSSNQASGNTDFDGVLAAGAESGTVSLTVATVVASVAHPDLVVTPAVTLDVMAPAAATVTVSGTLKIKGHASINLTGTFNVDSKALSVSGGGYSFTGSVASGRLSGTYTGPGGDGVFTAFPGGSTAVKLYCGTLSGDADGVWNLASTGSSLRGAFSVTGGGGELSGALSGSSVTLTFTGGTATGTLSGSGMSGTWSTLSGDAGSWTGSTASCP